MAEIERSLASAPSLTIFAPINEAVDRFETTVDIITPRLANRIVK